MATGAAELRALAGRLGGRAWRLLQELGRELWRLLLRLAWLIEQLRVDPERTRLRWWLAATEALIVLLVAGALTLHASGSLHSVADEQGEVRAQLAGAMARDGLQRMEQEALSSARTLADRSSLQNAVAEGPPGRLAQLLERYCDPDGLDACALYDGAALAAQAGPALPWAEIVAAAERQGQRFAAAPAAAPAPLFGAAASLGERPGARVYVVRLFNARLAATLSRDAGLEVSLVNYRRFVTSPVDAFTALHTAALADGRYAVQRIPGLDLYASSFPVTAPSGEVIALIETRLPAAQIDRSTSHLIRNLWLAALLLALLAIAASLVFGQFVAGPVQALTEAAVRLGGGDFSTSIPGGGAAEVGVLANTMEDMRRNLVDLTGTLRRRDAEARAVLAGIVEGVYAVDRNRRILYLNPQAARLLGVDPAEAVGRFCGELLRPRGEDGVPPCERHCPILEARVRGTARALERLQVGAGEARTAVITSSGMVDGLQVQVIRDETDLEAARRARDSVLANISHEFRTPLAAQLASIELLRDGLASTPPERLTELVLSLERGTLRLTRLIDNLLESVRIESGQLGIRRQSVDLGEVVEDARSLIGSLLVLRRQHLALDLPAELPLISGDRTRLTQVFVNLLANANKFAPEDSTLRIGARAQAGSVTAWVEDEGPGVPSGDEAIFERFRRSSGTEPEPGGLGLGLWLVKSIIERHGGNIAVARTPEARTRFSITLPVEGST